MLGGIAVRLVTDSNAMLPAELLARFEIIEVPLTIVVDGHPSLEPDLDLIRFYAHLRAGTPVSTAAPSPGQVVAAYAQAAADGADAILSIHVGSNQSATVAAVRLAAAEVDLPVTIVDTGTASFIEGCCVWRAAEAIEGGASIEGAAKAAELVAGEAASVFTVGEITRALCSGRLDVLPGDGVPVFASSGAEMAEVAKASTQADAVAAMAERVGQQPGPLRVGVGHADAPEDAAALEVALAALPQVAELTRYVVGPSVAAHTGSGTFGAVYHRI